MSNYKGHKEFNRNGEEGEEGIRIVTIQSPAGIAKIGGMEGLLAPK
jgi:hypothetical protein